MHPKSPSRGKLLAFSFLTTLLFLAGLNLLIETLETNRILNTKRLDDRIQFLGDDPPGPIAPSAKHPHNQGKKSIAEPSDEGEWRMYTHGGSFALGTPYRVGNFDEDRRGGISDFIEADLQARYPNIDARVHPRAAGSIASGMVTEILRRNLKTAPDLLFVATCNNEGSANPSEVSKVLNQLGGYRLLKRILKPEVAPEERPLHTVQEIQPEAIRAQFEINLKRIVSMAKKANTPMLLATLPINLRYAGHQISHPHDAGAQKPVPANTDASPCVAKAISLLEAGEAKAALDHLETCEEDPADVLRWRGLTLLELGRIDEGTSALSLSVELTPRNRCRPSLNAIIRRIAEEEPMVYLVDLEAKAKALSPDGIPGRNLFLDYCHMHWRGYYEMAQEVLRVMEEEGLLPEGTPGGVPPSREALRQAFKLNQINEAGDLPMEEDSFEFNIEFSHLENPEPGFSKHIIPGPPPEPGPPPPKSEPGDLP